jgi:hypothetical protein
MRSRDISNCANGDCPKKGSCHRFLTEEIFSKLPEPAILSMLMGEDCVKNNYNSFWDKEK